MGNIVEKIDRVVCQILTPIAGKIANNVQGRTGGLIFRPTFNAIVNPLELHKNISANQ